MVVTESAGHALYPHLNVELDYKAQLHRSAEAPPPGTAMWLQLEQSSLHLNHDEYRLVAMQSTDGRRTGEFELPKSVAFLEDPLAVAVARTVAAMMAQAAERGIVEDDPMHGVVEKLKAGEWVAVSAATSHRELHGRVRLHLHCTGRGYP